MKLKFKLKFFIFRGVELFSYVLVYTVQRAQPVFSCGLRGARLPLGRKEIVRT
jgi:hypothetical protein